jgi:hypothetical protein
MEKGREGDRKGEREGRGREVFLIVVLCNLKALFFVCPYHLGR